jgi:ribosomal protein S18 acetylase RimI-like enzyme
MEVKEIIDSSIKAKISTTILNSLPQWFGIPESTMEYINMSKEYIFFAIYDESKPVGFMSLKPTSQSTIEIYVMGVASEYHRCGFGTKLFNTALTWAQKNSYEFMQVKTLDSSRPNKEYEITRKFYEKLGFKSLECLTEIWGNDNPCLIMIQYIK